MTVFMTMIILIKSAGLEVRKKIRLRIYSPEQNNREIGTKTKTRQCPKENQAFSITKKQAEEMVIIQVWQNWIPIWL